MKLNKIINKKVVGAVMQRILLLVWVTLTIIFMNSCSTQKPIRRLSEVKDSYDHQKITEIDRLIEATTLQNRDIKASAVYYLSGYIEIVQNKKINKNFSEEEKEEYINTIKNHLIKTFAIQEDFNVRLLCLFGLNKIKSIESYNLYLQSIKDVDNSIKETTLKCLQKYINDSAYSEEELLNIHLDLLKSSNSPLIFSVLLNLSMFDNKNAKKAISNYISVSTNPEINLYAKSLLNEDRNAVK